MSSKQKAEVLSLAKEHMKRAKKASPKDRMKSSQNKKPGGHNAA